MSDYQTFLVPFDFSVHARAALYTAADLARRLGADLHLVHVIQSPLVMYGGGPHGGGTIPPPIDMGEVHRQARRSLGEVVDGIENFPGKIEPHVVEGAGLADSILECAEDLEADLIVMGTHGRTGLAHLFVGSVAERTLARAPCPVLTIQAPDDAVGEGEDTRNDRSERADPGKMETLREALARLERRGFEHAFRATADGRLALPEQPSIAPEDLVVVETVRFEGQSDPEDQAVLFALRSRDGRVQGTFVTSFGPHTDPDSAAAIHRLAPDPNRPMDSGKSA